MKLFKSIVFFFILSIELIYSQSVANYSVGRSTGIAYSSINSTGNAFASWRYSGGYSQDDNRSDLTNIGFDFWYNGTRYTQFSVSTNGFIDFSSSTANGGPDGGPYSYNNTQFYGNGSGTWLSIAPFYDDMTAQGGTEALGNSIKYLVSGTAPNRVLTVEWINMAVYGNTDPDLNFQVKLYETTGVIDFLYGVMNNGGIGFSYTIGINAATLNNTPTAAQLLCQQTANTATFGNTEVGNLSAMPAADSRLRFTPSSTTPSPSGSLSFTSVTSTGMTVNWTNWCTNELGYVLYSSTDGTNYNFVSQTAANATSYAATGLLPSTLYYWRMYAVTEGALSSATSGSQSTAAGGNKVSAVASGNWNTAGSWTPSGVPTAADNVTIANGHTITIDVNAVCNNLTVGQGTSGVLRIGSSTTSRTVTVNSNVTINNGGQFITNNGFTATHNLTVQGNITNNGTLNFRAGATSLCNVAFSKNGNQTISGTGATTNFNLISLNMSGNINNTVEFTSTNFSAPNNFLTLTSGTFKLSTTGTVNITPYTGLATINNNSGFNINSSSITVAFAGGVDLYGRLYANSGNVNIGDAANENVQSIGGNFQVNGGTVTIAGRYYSTDINSPASFSISGGSITMPTVSSTSTTISPFHINAAGSSLTMTNGSIIIEREGGSGAQNLGFYLNGITSGSRTGGTIQFGNGSTPASQTFNFSSDVSIGGISVSSSNATTFLNSTLATVNNLTISSGTLDANNYAISLGGNWTNNGAFSAGTGTATFNGGSAQTLSGSSTTAFTNLTINNTAGVNITSGTYTLSDVLTLNNGTFSSGGNSFTLLSSATKTARIAPVTGTGAFSGNFIIERFISSRGTLTWANLSSPVLSTTVQDWDNELFFSYPYNYPYEVGNVLIYDETIADYKQVSSSTTITPGMGFEIFLTDDVTMSTWSNTTINTIGTPTTGTQLINLDYTPAASPYEGQNLIGNPFVSAIQVNLMTPTNALAAVDVYDNVSGNYITLSGTDLIAPHQGFWAYATAPGASMSIPESAKSTSLTQTIKSSETETYMELKLESADQNHNLSHTLKMASAVDALNGWDLKDHPFRKSPNKLAPSIFVKAENSQLVINTFNSNQENYTAFLSTSVGIEGNYKITSTGMNFITDNFKCVVLVDKFLNKKVDLNKVDNYVFYASPEDNENRFEVHFEKYDDCKYLDNVIGAFENNSSTQIIQTTTGINIKFNSKELINNVIQVSNILGQELISPFSLETTSESIEIPLPDNFKGVFIVKVSSLKNEYVQKFIKL